MPIAAGQTLYQDVDLAEFHNLEDDTYDVSTAGYLPYAEGGSRALCGSSHSYTSNTLSIPVEGARARQVTKAIDRLEIKRTTIQSDCSSQQSSSITAANQECVTMANNAASAATSGSGSLFETYFGSSSTSTRQTVADNFQKIAQECSSTPGGNSESHCTDPYGSCGGTLLAYTIWRDGGGFGQSASRQGTLYYCPRYFDVLAAAPAQCQQQSQATNTLHETSHAVLATEDLAYGFSGVTRLSTEQAVVNADTYALYANGELFFGLFDDAVCLLLTERQMSHYNADQTDQAGPQEAAPGFLSRVEARAVLRVCQREGQVTIRKAPRTSPGLVARVPHRARHGTISSIRGGAGSTERKARCATIVRNLSCSVE